MDVQIYTTKTQDDWRSEDQISSDYSRASSYVYHVITEVIKTIPPLPPPFVLSLRKNLRIYTYGKRNRKTASQVCSPPDSVQDGDSESLYNADPCWLSVVIAQPIVVIDILKSCFKK